MLDNTTFLVGSDGIKLHTQSWNILKPKAVVVLVHGFGEHIGRYHDFAEFFNAEGFAVQGIDMRGHGKSDGKRGHTPNYNAFLDDLEIFIELVKKNYPNYPMFLYGHSMGGAIVLNYVTQRVSKLTGVIASAPLILLSFKPNPVTLFLGKQLRKLIPTFTQSGGIIVENLSRDKEIVEKYKADPLVHNKVSAEQGIAMLENGEKLNQFSAKMPIPTLILHGTADKLTLFSASEAFAKRVSGDVTFKEYKGFYHELHNEPEKKEILKYVSDWLNSKLKA